MDSTSIPSRIGVREIAKPMGGSRPVKAKVAWINAESQVGRELHCPEVAGYWKGAKAAAEKWGFWIEEFRMGPEVTPEGLHHDLKARGIRGILLPPHSHQPHWEDFPWEEYAVVRLGRSLRFPRAHLVASDEMSNAMLAYRSMRERGYRRIAFVTGRVELAPDGHALSAGWFASQQLTPEEERVPAFTFMAHPVQERVERFRRWLDDFQPDAILSDVPGIGDLLKEANVEAPRDLGLAMTQVLDGGADSGVDRNAEEIGHAALLMVNSQINEGRKGEPKILRQLLVQGNWVDGTSLPRLQ